MLTKHVYQLTWAPEGKPIGIVEATSAKAARGIAPMPYRKFKGEISVTCLDPSSFVAVITSNYGKLLLGGVTKLVSSRFETEQMARDYIKAIRDTQSANIRTWEIVPSDKKPEIKK